MPDTEPRDVVPSLRQEVKSLKGEVQDLREEIRKRDAQDENVVGYVCVILAVVANSAALWFLFLFIGKYAALAHPVALALILFGSVLIFRNMSDKPLLLILIIAIVLLGVGTAMYVRSEFKREVTKPEITQPKETKK